MVARTVAALAAAKARVQRLGDPNLAAARERVNLCGVATGDQTAADILPVIRSI